MHGIFPIDQGENMDDSSVDSRGVQRGQCTQCACAGYNGGVHKKKCANSDCGHPPGKHINLSNPQSQSGAMTPSSSHSAAAALSGRQESHHSMESVHGVGPSQLSHHHHQPQSLPYQAFPGALMLVDLSECKAEGCNNRVHFELFLPPSMQMFDYCSPVCRDRDLLEIHKLQLKYDLEALSKQLQHSVLADKTNQESALIHRNQFQHSNPTGFSNPSGSSVDTVSRDPKLSSTSVDTKLIRKPVQWKRTSCENFGVIVCMNMFHSEKEISGFLITGVQKGSDAYRMMQNSQLCLLDIVDSTSCKDLPSVANTQKCFDDLLQHPAGKFYIYRSESLTPKPCTKLISAVKKTRASHIFVMVPQLGKEFGLKVKSKSNAVVVTEACEDLPAYLCGVRHGDVICALATTKSGSTREIDWDSESLLCCQNGRKLKEFYEDIKQALEVAHKNNKAVILDIFRSGKSKK